MIGGCWVIPTFISFLPIMQGWNSIGINHVVSLQDGEATMIHHVCVSAAEWMDEGHNYLYLEKEEDYSNNVAMETNIVEAVCAKPEKGIFNPGTRHHPVVYDLGLLKLDFCFILTEFTFRNVLVL